MAGSKKPAFSIGAIALVAVIVLANYLLGGFSSANATTNPDPAAPPAAAPVEQPAIPRAAGPGFRSQRSLDQHFEKHGHEFGFKTAADYLALAQQLRDRQPGPRLLEEVRKDGVVTRFDRDTGAFLAYNRDRTIRTLFKPNDGERYFRRQLERDH